MIKRVQSHGGQGARSPAPQGQYTEGPVGVNAAGTNGTYESRLYLLVDTVLEAKPYLALACSRREHKFVQ